MLIEVNNLSKKIRGKQILKDVSLYVDEGETVGLIGKNGAGKTSLLKCIAGLWRYSQGSVTVAGKRLKPCAVSQDVSALIGYPTLFPEMTLKENIEYFGVLSSSDCKKRAYALAELLQLSEDIEKPLKQFSSGMKQKACLLIALMRKPKCLILDEPTSMLGPLSACEIRDFIKQLKNYGTSVLISSHNLTEVEGLCSRVLVIDEGKIIREINVAKTKTRFYLEFASAKELKRVLNISASYKVVEQDDISLIFIGSARDLTKFVNFTNPRLTEIKKLNSLENAYVNEK